MQKAVCAISISSCPIQKRYHASPRSRLTLRRNVRSLNPSSESDPPYVSIFGTNPKEDNTRSELTETQDISTRSHLGHIVEVKDGVIMIQGLPSEISISSRLVFENGSMGILCWTHSFDITFALLATESAPRVGDKTIHIFRDGEKFEIETGIHLIGSVLENAINTLSPENKKQTTPLLNVEVNMDSRQCISRPIFMQHKGIDILTPIGRGQCILLMSQNERPLTILARHMIQAQEPSITIVYGCFGKTKEMTDLIRTEFQRKRILDRCVFIQAPETSSLGERYAALCAALSIGENIRDQGGDALVILDTVQPLTDLWNHMQTSSARYQASLAIVEDGENSFVNIDGTYMASKTADRRRFFSALLQRAAQVSAKLGGGSLTLIPTVVGRPAVGAVVTDVQSRLQVIENDPKLSDSVKAKLRKKLIEMQISSIKNDDEFGLLPTFLIEEFMSIADGQIVITSNEDGNVVVDPLLSVSRIGSRAYSPILESIAPKIRFYLAQSADAAQMGYTAETAASTRWNQKIENIKAALVQSNDVLCPLSHQVITLMALDHPRLQELSKCEIASILERIIAHFKSHHPEILQIIDEEQKMDVSLKNQVDEILDIWISHL